MIPNGWKLNTVDDLFETNLGKMLNQVAKTQTPQYKYLGNSDVKWGCFDFSKLKSMHFSEKEINKFMLKKGDILMCEGGEVGRCSIWNSGLKGIYYQKALHRLRSKGNIVPEYFYNFMTFIAGTRALDSFTTRTSIAHLTKDKLLRISIKTPPLPEQQKIAKILSTWDKAISTTECLISNSKQQKKALMQQLLTGDHKGKRLLDDSGKPFEGEWKNFKLGDICKMNSGGTPKSSFVEYYGGEIPWVSIADMTKHGKWIDSTGKYLTKLGIDNSSARLYPAGTVLYAMYASIGECSISTVELASSQAILGIRPSSILSNIYLYYFLGHLKEKIILMGQQGTQSNLNAGMVKNFTISLPLLVEQQKIAVVLTNADQEIELLEQQLSNFKQEKKALMQQLLTGKRRVTLTTDTKVI
ncbi:MAG: restriction endonuclease subunit S [Colwellia sp.]|nr:restriction endonuclease subunit S [Colwellia sp.]